MASPPAIAQLVKEGTRLYRRVLRSHRLLPAEMRALGDSHVRHEWREVFLRAPARGGAGRGALEPHTVREFLSQWRTYAEMLESGEIGGMREDLAHLNDDQLSKMGELREAAATSAAPPDRGDGGGGRGAAD